MREAASGGEECPPAREVEGGWRVQTSGRRLASQVVEGRHPLAESSYATYAAAASGIGRCLREAGSLDVAQVAQASKDLWVGLLVFDGFGSLVRRGGK